MLCRLWGRYLCKWCHEMCSVSVRSSHVRSIQWVVVLMVHLLGINYSTWWRWYHIFLHNWIIISHVCWNQQRTWHGGVPEITGCRNVKLTSSHAQNYYYAFACFFICLPKSLCCITPILTNDEQEKNSSHPSSWWSRSQCAKYYHCSWVNDIFFSHFSSTLHKRITSIAQLKLLIYGRN